MKKSKSSAQGIQSNNTVQMSNYYSNKLEQAGKMLEHVEGCVFGGGRPIPANVTTAYAALLIVYEKSPGLFVGEKVYLWEMLGWAYHLLGDMRKADLCLRLQAKFQPGCADAFINLGWFYEKGEMYEQAVKVYLDGLGNCPGDEYLSYNLAQLLGRRGMQDGALNHINAAIFKNPHRPYNHKVKGDILKRGGSLQEAALCYEKAIALFGTADDTEKQDAVASLAELRQQLKIEQPYCHREAYQVESLVDVDDVLFDEECYKDVNSEEEAYSYVRYFSAKAPKFRGQLIERNWPQEHITRLMDLLWKRVILGCIKYGVPLTTEAELQAKRFGIDY